MVLSFACFSRSLTATHMKSSITQIERHFDISTTHVGLIDGSFEMGNVSLLLWALMVSGKSSDSFLFPLGGRQPVVSSCDQPFWGPASPTQVHFRGLFGHGSGGPPHRSDSLLHGTVNGRKHAVSRTTEGNWLSLSFCGAVTSTEPWARVSRMTPWTTRLVWKELCLTWTRRGLRTETLVRICSFGLDQKKIT